eukprot:2884916-Prymnesium_polylepis.1
MSSFAVCTDSVEDTVRERESVKCVFHCAVRTLFVIFAKKNPHESALPPPPSLVETKRQRRTRLESGEAPRPMPEAETVPVIPRRLTLGPMMPLFSHGAASPRRATLETLMPQVSRHLWSQRRRSLLPVFARRDTLMLPRTPDAPPFLTQLRRRRVRQASRDSHVGLPVAGAEEPFNGRPRDALAGLRRHTIAAMGGGEAWVPIVTVSGNLGETSSWNVVAAPKSSVRSRSTSRVADQEAARSPSAAVAYSSQDAEPLRSSTGFTQLLLRSSKLELSDSYTRFLLRSSQLSNSGQTAATASNTCESGAIEESEALTGSALIDAMRELLDAGGPDNVVLKIVRQSLHGNVD